MSHEHKTRGGTKVVIERTYRAQIEDVWDLWTTKAGFESWWGPQGFRVEVQTLDARVGGTLHYVMIADSPEMIAAMKQMGRRHPDVHRAAADCHAPSSVLVDDAGTGCEEGRVPRRSASRVQPPERRHRRVQGVLQPARSTGVGLEFGFADVEQRWEEP
jgi:hypothetical protein